MEGNCVVSGVKGLSVIMLLPLFTTSFFCTEYMHMFSLWFDIVNSGHRWYFGTRLADLDKLLEGIRSPNEISHTHPAINARSYWKAFDYKPFLLYNGPVILKGFLPRDHYNYFMLFVVVYYNLLHETISSNRISCTNQISLPAEDGLGMSDDPRLQLHLETHMNTRHDVTFRGRGLKPPPKTTVIDSASLVA